MKKVLFLFPFVLSNPLIAGDLGKQTYELTCKTCHAPAMAKRMGAPAAFDKKAWAERFEKASDESKNNASQFKTPMDYLLYKVSIGKGFMPHGGLCKETNAPSKNCSNEAMTEAIEYMSGNTKAH